MASIYHPRYPTGKISPYLNLSCWLRGQGKAHYLALRYPDGTRVRNERDAWKMCREHEASCQGTASERTVAYALNVYLDSTPHERSPSVQVKERQRVPILVSYLACSLHELSRDRIEDALNRLMAERKISPVTRDHYLKLLRACCRWCVIVKAWLPRDPTQGIARIGRSPSRDFLPYDRWGEFLEYARRSRTYPGTATALMAGLRRGELLKMIAQDFSLDRREIRLRREVSKNQEEVLLPMMDALVPILKPVLAHLKPQERVFPYYAESWRLSVKRWLVKMGYQAEGAGLHTLRHSFCTWAYERFGEYKGMLLARHKSLEMARRYVHLRKMPVSPEEMSLNGSLTLSIDTHSHSPTRNGKKRAA